MYWIDWYYIYLLFVSFLSSLSPFLLFSLLIGLFCVLSVNNKSYSSELDPVTRSILEEYTPVRKKMSLRAFPSLAKHQTTDRLQHWNFNVFEFAESNLLVLMKQMFLEFDLIERFRISEVKLEQFLLAVQSKYNSNPYHNFRHAFDVTQAVFSILTTFGGAEYFSYLNIFALLVAAICHDIG